MRITTLEVENFRKFDRRMRLDGLGPGLNVLCEPNEFGKSTLLAAIKAVIFERHRSRAEGVRQMKHVRHDTFPTVSLGFDLGDAPHHVEKRFLHREPYARLTLPHGTRVEGDAAEEQLQTLLGFAPPGKQGANADSIGLWGALWCAQQAAGEQPMLPAMGRAALHACLEAELGALAGDNQSHALLGQVEVELGRLLDGRGNPKGRYRDAAGELQQTVEELHRLSRKRTGLSEAIDKLAQLRKVLAQASDAEAEAQLARDLAEARQRRDLVRQHDDWLRHAVTQLELATQRQADAASETARRADRAWQSTLAEAALLQAEQAEAEAATALGEAEATLASRRASLPEAETIASTATTALRHADAVAALVLRSAQTIRLRDQQGRAEEAQSEVNRLSGLLAAQPATDARLRAAGDASVALDRARILLDAQATEIGFDLLPAATGVLANGRPVPPGTSAMRVIAETLIELPGLGRIQVRPMVQDRTKLQAAVDAATGKLRTALAAMTVTDLDAAEAAAASRRTTEAALRRAAAALAAEAPGDAGAGVAAGLEALRNHVATESSRMEAELARHGLASLPTEAAASAAALLAREAEAAAAQTFASAGAAMEAPQAVQQRAAAARSNATAQATEARNNCQRLSRETAAAIGQEADEALAGRLRVTATARAAEQASVAQLRQQAPAETVELLDARIRRFEEAARQQVASASQLREDIARISATVAYEQGEGLDETISAAERRHEDLGVEHAGLAREATVLTLLRDTLRDAEKATRARYRAPVMRRMTPYLRGLFPDVEVTLDDDLRVTGLTRRAEAEAIALLSDGTREQVAVLLRLAYADVLRERGKPAMLILDDALAYSDPGRRELTFDLLTNAASTMQILILTCRADSIRRLGGNRVTLVAV